MLDGIIPKYILWYMATNTKTLLTVKTDKKLKKSAQDIANILGFSLGTLVNSFLKQLVRTRRVDYSDYTPNAETIASLVQGEKEYAEGRLPPPMEVHDLIAELNS